MEDVKAGKGSVGKLLRDTSMAFAATEAIEKIKNVGTAADSLSARIGSLVSSIDHDVNEGKGPVNALLKDEELTRRLSNTLKNIEQDTKSFGEVMEALKHNFLLRGYFRRLEKQKNEQKGDHQE